LQLHQILIGEDMDLYMLSQLCQELIHPTLGAPTIHPGEPTRLLPTLLLVIPLLAIRLQGTHPLDIRLDILTSFILS